MSRETFEIAYDGTAVRDHGMDVHDLAPALLAVGNLIREVNTELNGGRARVNVFVRPDFEHKCFDINLELVQTILQQARDLLDHEDIRTAKDILDWIGIITAPVSFVGLSLFAYLRLRKGRPIAQKTHIVDQTGSGMVQLQFEGDKNPIAITQNIYNLGENPKIKDAADSIFEPLEREGYESVETRKNGTTVEKFDKEAADSIRRSCQLEPDDIMQEFEPQTIVAHLQIYSPVYDTDSSIWRFLFGGETIRADITDTGIAEHAIARGGVLVNDVYKVKLQITEYKTRTGQMRKRYKILEMIELIPTPKQEKLL